MLDLLKCHSVNKVSRDAGGGTVRTVLSAASFQIALKWPLVFSFLRGMPLKRKNLQVLSNESFQGATCVQVASLKMLLLPLCRQQFEPNAAERKRGTLAVFPPNPATILKETPSAHFTAPAFILGCYKKRFTRFNAQIKNKRVCLSSCLFKSGHPVRSDWSAHTRLSQPSAASSDVFSPPG